MIDFQLLSYIYLLFAHKMLKQMYLCHRWYYDNINSSSQVASYSLVMVQFSCRHNSYRQKHVPKVNSIAKLSQIGYIFKLIFEVKL